MPIAKAEALQRPPRQASVSQFGSVHKGVLISPLREILWEIVSLSKLHKILKNGEVVDVSIFTDSPKKRKKSLTGINPDINM